MTTYNDDHEDLIKWRKELGDDVETLYPGIIKDLKNKYLASQINSDGHKTNVKD